jgi:hypothetical protein
VSRPSGHGLRSYNGAWAAGLAEGNEQPHWGNCGLYRLRGTGEVRPRGKPCCHRLQSAVTESNAYESLVIFANFVEPDAA